MSAARVRSASPTYRFGPFELDAGRRRLRRGDTLVTLADRQLDVLLLLVAHAGRVLTKDELTDGAWRGVAVSDSSLVQVVKRLRLALGTQDGGDPYIETAMGQGYSFVAAVERVSSAGSEMAIDALLHPYRAFIDGRAALETLDRDAAGHARQAFAEAVRLEPGFPAAHIGLANACLLAFEATRADAAPDRDALRLAERHAREACRLEPSSGEAWSTLALAQHRSGQRTDAAAAARRAVTLEPHEWRPHLRAALVSWGEDRLRASRRVLALCPGLAMGHWLAATVHLARGAADAAAATVREGCAAQDAQTAGRLPGVGLHLVHGLMIAARGDRDAAIVEIERELQGEDSGHIYARECAANAWYAIGALQLRARRAPQAATAFREALARVPGHALATAGLSAVSPVGLPAVSGAAPEGLDPAMVSDPGTVDAAIVRAARLTLEHRHADAAAVCAAALRRAEPGQDGWLLPIEPLLGAAEHPDAWAPALAELRARAF